MIIVNVCSFRCSISLRLCQIRFDSNALMHLYTCSVSLPLCMCACVRVCPFLPFFCDANPFFSILCFVNFSLVCIADVPIFYIYFPFFFYYDVYFPFYHILYLVFVAFNTGVIVFCHCVSLLYLFLYSMSKRAALSSNGRHFMRCTYALYSRFYLMRNDEHEICFIYSSAYFFHPLTLANQILIGSYQFGWICVYVCVFVRCTCCWCYC